MCGNLTPPTLDQHPEKGTHFLREVFHLLVVVFCVSEKLQNKGWRIEVPLTIEISTHLLYMYKEN